MNPTIAFLGSLGPLEFGVIGLVALLLFGKRLPEVMRSMGKGIVEFKKGLKGVEDDIEQQSDPKQVDANIKSDSQNSQSSTTQSTQSTTTQSTPEK